MLKVAMRSQLIDEPSALGCTTQALDLHVLNGELVVVRDLLHDLDVALRIDANLLLPLHRYDLGDTVGL